MLKGAEEQKGDTPKRGVPCGTQHQRRGSLAQGSRNRNVIWKVTSSSVSGEKRLAVPPTDKAMVLMSLRSTCRSG